MNGKRLLSQYLQHLQRLGVTHLPEVHPVEPDAGPATTVAQTTPAAAVETTLRARAEARAAGAPPVQKLRSATTPSGIVSPALLRADSTTSPGPLPEISGLMQATFESRATREAALCQLAGVVSKCTRCQELAGTRTQTVFGVGNPEARIMLIGEAPGADEDAQGEPFVGKAGQLLNKIIEASQLKRDDVYICNILRCRPPGNRNPQPQEAANCREYLDAQIHIVSPEFIICWGTVAAQNLLSETRPVGKLRGAFHDYRGIRVMCTYHPSYLLRNPAAKKDVWDDMKFFMRELGVELQ